MHFFSSSEEDEEQESTQLQQRFFRLRHLLLATAVVVGGLVGRLLQVVGMVVPVSAEFSFAFVLREREVFFDCFVKVLAGKGDGQEGEDQQEG